jgi:hypothetical protein
MEVAMPSFSSERMFDRDVVQHVMLQARIKRSRHLRIWVRKMARANSPALHAVWSAALNLMVGSGFLARRRTWMRVAQKEAVR